MDAVLDYLLYVGIPLVIAFGAYFMKTIISRIDKLELKTSEHITATETRVLLADKLDPIKSDLHDIKESVSKLFDLYYKDKK